MLSHLILALAGSARLAYAMPLDVRADGAHAYSTNQDLSNKNTEIDTPTQGKGDSGGGSTWDLAFDDTGAGNRQTITGFGGCVTDATVTSFGTLGGDDLNSLLDEMKHFNLMRHTIASSDLSGDPAYSYDDNGGNADESLSGFNLGDRGNAMASLIKNMRSLNANMQLLGSPWSPPGWMKVSGELFTGGDGNPENKLQEGDNGGADYSQQFADYFVKYIQAFNEAGATVNAITIQNEPLNNRDGYPTMLVQPDESANLINQYVGPALRNASIPVWAYDHNTDRPDYAETVMDGAGDYVDSAAWHCYQSGGPDWSVLSSFHDKYPDKKQYMTECYTTDDYNNWDQVAGFTMGPLQNWASGSIAWTLGTDDSFGPHLPAGSACSNCRGLITANSGGYTLTNDYYVMSQFSKYIPAGATVINNTEGNYSYDDGTGIQSVATKNPDGTTTVVIWSKLNDDVLLTSTFASGAVWSGNVPARSVTTWVLP